MPDVDLPSSAPPTPRDVPRPRMLTFASGGWILLLAALFSMAAVAWVVSRIRPALGNGRDIATYRFDLTHLLIPVHELTPALSRDTLPALVDPRTQSIAEAQLSGQNQYRRYLHDETRVIGVTLHGASRCYPLPVLELHEICNDTVGGTPIVVTYSPLTDAVVVARRTVGGQVREFGGSGLLRNSGLVMYDRQPHHVGESLWDQLTWRAVAGPAAAQGLTLDLVPCQLITWQAWRTAHPDGRVILGRPDLASEYPRRRYQNYLSTGEIRFPVAPLWEDPVRAAKTPIAAVRDGSTWRVYLLRELAALPAAQRAKLLAASPVPLTFDAQHATLAAAPSSGTDVIYALLFAWYAEHPADTHGHLVP